MSNHERKTWQDPDTPINVPKVAKKEVIRWAVPALITLVLMAFLALVKMEAAEMLKAYKTIDAAKQDHDIITSRVNDYATQVGKMQETLYLMDKKLDHLQDEFDYNVRDPRVLTPKMKDATP